MEAQRIAKLATFTQLVNVQIQDSNLHAKMLGYSMHFFSTIGSCATIQLNLRHYIPFKYIKYTVLNYAVYLTDRA